MRKELNLTLFLIRHGETDHNLNRADVVGQSFDEPLNNTGKQQALLLGERLRKEVVFDSVFVSAMPRAQSTFEIAAPKVNGTCMTGVQDLIEIQQGEAAGKKHSELFPDAAAWERYKRNGMGFAFPGGESQFDVQARVWTFLDKQLFSNPNIRLNTPLNVGVFSHGLTLRCLLQKVMGFDHLLTGRLWLQNTSISKVRLKNSNWFIDTINDHAHLLNAI